jgi:hypothetical protein
MAHEKAKTAPAEEKIKAEIKKGAATANVLLENERVRVSDIRIKPGDKTKFSGLVNIGNDRKMYLECIGAGSPTVVLVSGFRAPTMIGPM